MEVEAAVTLVTGDDWTLVALMVVVVGVVKELDDDFDVHDTVPASIIQEPTESINFLSDLHINLLTNTYGPYPMPYSD